MLPGAYASCSSSLRGINSVGHIPRHKYGDSLRSMPCSVLFTPFLRSKYLLSLCSFPSCSQLCGAHRRDKEGSCGCLSGPLLQSKDVELESSTLCPAPARWLLCSQPPCAAPGSPPTPPLTAPACPRTRPADPLAVPSTLPCPPASKQPRHRNCWPTAKEHKLQRQNEMAKPPSPSDESIGNRGLSPPPVPGRRRSAPRNVRLFLHGTFRAVKSCTKCSLLQHAFMALKCNRC